MYGFQVSKQFTYPNTLCCLLKNVGVCESIPLNYCSYNELINYTCNTGIFS